MAEPKKWIVLVMLFMLSPLQACPPCDKLCHEKRQRKGRGWGTLVKCNVTGLNCSNQELSSCLQLQDGDDALMLEGHYDSNGTLNRLPELSMLNSLLLTGGNIRDIRDGTFKTLTSLRLLSLNGNSIQVVGTWFEGLGALERLDMFRNKIENIERGAFHPLKKLQFLDMSENRIRSIQAWYFEGLSSLLRLNFNNNKISHVAANAFNLVPRVNLINLGYNMLQTLSPEWFENLPPRANVYLDNNLLPTITQETIVAFRGKFVHVWKNPFRCTCALTILKTEGMTVLRGTENLYCSYPPHLAGKKISQLSREDMPCPPPVAKVSRADNGTTLLCEVYWEQQPDISWVGPEGTNISASSNTSGNGITTQLEHTVTPEGHSVSFGSDCSSQDTEGSTLNYMGKSTYKLQMSQEDADFLWWPWDAYRCAITYQVGNFSANLVLSLTNSRANDSRSLTSDDGARENGSSTDIFLRNGTTPVGVAMTTENMPVEYFLLPPRQNSCMLHLIYTGIISVGMSFLVALLLGWLVRPKRPERPNNPAMRQLPPLPSSRRSSQDSLHQYEVIPDGAVTSLPLSDKKLNNHKRRSRHTDVFNNPQYWPGNVKQQWSKETEVFYNPQYGQGNRRRRWSTPVLVTYSGVGAVPRSAERERSCPVEEAKQIKDLAVLGKDWKLTGGKKSPAPCAHRYMLPQTKKESKDPLGMKREDVAH